MRAGGLICAALLLGASAARADVDRYVGFIYGSAHIGSNTLNGVNPGLTYGLRWPTANPRYDWFAEGGVFFNSYRETSPLALFGVSTVVGRVAGVTWRAGAAVGTAYYKRLSVGLKANYGIPNLGGFIPMAALSLSGQVGRTEVRLTTVPAAGDVKAIVNLSVAWHF
jgi:hypothetical protein